MTESYHILLLNGPNLNLLGTREPDKYGTLTLADIVATLTRDAGQCGVTLSHLQSNAEHELIDRIHAARGNTDFILINPPHSLTPVWLCVMPCWPSASRLSRSICRMYTHGSRSVTTLISLISPPALSAGWVRKATVMLYRQRFTVCHN